VVFGIHIAAPAWPCARFAVDKVARERLSTVYMPGHKLTMLPDEVVQAYTLIEGRDCPAVSLYVTLRRGHAGSARPPKPGWSGCPSPPTCATTSWTSVVTDSALTGERRPTTPCRASWPLLPPGRHLKAQREVVRGKPENFNRPDYNFRLEGNEGEPNGDETVRISSASAARRWT
jgi:exoribonuclease-2